MLTKCLLFRSPLYLFCRFATVFPRSCQPVFNTLVSSKTRRKKRAKCCQPCRSISLDSRAFCSSSSPPSEVVKLVLNWLSCFSGSTTIATSRDTDTTLEHLLETQISISRLLTKKKFWHGTTDDICYYRWGTRSQPMRA